MVLLVLDEFPGDSLLDRSGAIDSGRFPNFAALAGDSTWFRNAASSTDSTTKAVPLILDGVRPVPGTAPEVRDHPLPLFGSGRPGATGSGLREGTASAAPSVRGTGSMPSGDHPPPQRRPPEASSVRARDRPQLALPRSDSARAAPARALPVSPQARTRDGARDLVPNMNGLRGFGHPYLTRHNEQRYLLQLGFVDRLLGRLLRQLKRMAIYDDTMVVVTADHGFAAQVGVDTRRSVNDANVEEPTPVPLLVKAPGQRRSRVNDAYAQTLDVTPTIADVLNVPWAIAPTDALRSRRRCAAGRAWR